MTKGDLFFSGLAKPWMFALVVSSSNGIYQILSEQGCLVTISTDYAIFAHHPDRGEDVDTLKGLCWSFR